MATHTIATGEIGLHEVTLSANTTDTVNIADDWKVAEIISDGADDLYVTGDGSTPTVGGANTRRLPGGAVTVANIRLSPSNGAVVKLKSAGTPTFSVQLP